jgi:replicative DNA helicase
VNLALERRLLGTALAFPDQLLPLRAAGVSAGVFAVDPHRHLWELLCRRAESGLLTDIASLTDTLTAHPERYGQLGDVIALEGVAEPTPYRLNQLTKALVSLQRRREAARVLREAQRALVEPEPEGPRAAQVLELLSEARSWVADPLDLDRWSMRAACEGFAEHANRLHLQAVAVAPWPGGPPTSQTTKPLSLHPDDLRPGNPIAWPKLADLAQPLAVDRLVVAVGPTGRGKSSFALGVAEAAARSGAPVLYLSCEMAVDELVARLLALRASPGPGPYAADGVPWSALLYRPVSTAALSTGLDHLVQDCGSLYLWAPPPAERTPAHLAAMARAVGRRHPGQPPLIVVDYVQRMADGDDIRLAVRALSGELRALCRVGRASGQGSDWPGAAAFVLSTAGRQHYQSLAGVEALTKACQDPVTREGLIGAGKESGELEADAGLLLAITTDPGTTSAARPAVCAVLKNRAGGTGTVPMVFSPACGRFTERDQGQRTLTTGARL